MLNMTTADRITARMKQLNIKGVDITRRIGASSGTISNWKNGTNTPKGNYLVGLCRVLECSPEWLINGTGIAEPRQEYNTSALRTGLIKGSVPLISWVQAGAVCNNGDQIPMDEDTENVLVSKKYGDNAYALRVEGESMHDPANPRSFPPGCYIVVDPDAEAENGSFVVVRQNGDETTFKQLIIEGNTQYLQPINQRYEVIKVTPDTIICGVVKEKIIHHTY